MFKVDSKFDDMEPGDRKAARDAELRPLMEDFGGWARVQLPLASPKLALHRALQYAVEFWPYVMNVFEDGHLELSNNVAEQAQRIFVVGRKNWLFSDAPRGARASAAIYSVTTTAKANGLNPRLYVEWLLTEMPNAGSSPMRLWTRSCRGRIGCLSPASSTQPLPRSPKRCLTTS